MGRKGLFCVAILGMLLITINVLAKNEDIVPKVEILSPLSGTATNQNTIDVAVWFSAYKDQSGKDVGNVHTVKLLLNGQVVGTYQNPPNIKSGGVNFTVSLSGLTEGTATLQAIAFQGSASFSGSPDPRSIRIPAADKSEVSVTNLSFWDNPVGPVLVSARAGGKWEVLVSLTDEDPNDNKYIWQVPTPGWGVGGGFSAYFAISSPEVYLVRETTPNSGTFERIESISTWDPYETEIADAPKFYIEAKLPLSEPVTTTGGLRSFGPLRSGWFSYDHYLTKIIGSIGQVILSNLTMGRIPEKSVPGRYHTYRTQNPIVYISRTKADDEAPPALPAGNTYAQIVPEGRTCPYAMADKEINGAFNLQDISFRFGEEKSFDMNYYNSDKKTYFFVWNADDDNKNGYQDRYDTILPINEEDDLVPLRIAVDRPIFGGEPQGNIIFNYEKLGNSEIKVFTDKTKKQGSEITEFPFIKSAKDAFPEIKVYIEGIKQSNQISDIRLTVARELNNRKLSWDTAYLTIVPLIAMKADTVYRPWINGQLDPDNNNIRTISTSLHGITWEPKGSYALAVGDRATVVKFIPHSTQCPIDYKLTMSISWRDQLDKLKLHNRSYATTKKLGK